MASAFFLESFIDISYDVSLEAHGIVVYHGACILHVDGLHIETCS
jgi:hypothetical protein